MNARPIAPWIATVIAACSCGGGQSSTAPTAHADPEVIPSEERTAGPSADYEVHEWGLVRGGPGDTQVYGVLAPPIDYSMMSVDKPVLYFHAPAALTLASVGVEARSGGTLLETWPLTHLGTSAAWTNVAIDPTGECTPSALASATEAPCTTLPAGQACETPTLAVVRTTDAACVHVGASTERFLFYRGNARTFTPPLRFERTGAYETVRVTNEGDAVIPGMVVRLVSDGFRVRTLAVAPPAPHQSIDVHADFDAAAVDHTTATDEDVADRRGAVDMPAAPASGPGRAALHQTMIDLGLTESEADAFHRAWDGALFGGGRAAIDTLTVDDEARARDGELAPQESFVYFLPAASLEDLAHLELDPPPRGGVHRAIAMWSMLRASGASH